MFSIKSLLIILPSVFLPFRLVSSESKCVYIPTRDYELTAQGSYVECRHVRYMHDLLKYMNSNWNRLKIVNEEDSVFTNEGVFL